MPSRSGRPEIDQQQVRLVRARLDFAARGGLGLDDAIVRGREQHPQHVADARARLRRRRSGAWPGSCASLRCVGSVNSKRAPPCGRVLARSRRRAHDDGAADREAQPDARDAALAGATLELVEQPRRDRRAAAPARHRRRARARTLLPPTALTIADVPGGVYLARLSNRLANTCTTRLASTYTGGRSVGQCQLDCDGRASRRSRRCSATAARSSTDSQSRRSAGAPDSKRVRSSTFEMSSDISWARRSMRVGERAARRLIERVAVLRERAAGTRHDRERRAQVVRDRRQQRVAQALALRGDARGLGLRGELLALERQADLPGEGFEQVQLLGQRHAPRDSSAVRRARRARRWSSPSGR